ncbi:MAG: DUF262 domain-containing protein [Undibacterium sp.]|nr:DUF262 domain-containing protein [Undibacterium sp.]
MNKLERQTVSENFFTNGVRIVKLTDWLEWTIGGETIIGKWTIVLPMIQRGSVWKPHQVIDLWDTVLRGMPFGGLMASHIPVSADGPKISFFQPLDRKLVTLKAPGGLSLIDGQQRTLAMLIGWPGIAQQMSRRLWVDFGDDDKFDHLLRLHITTETHPFGYKTGSNSGETISRLTLSERRHAAATYADRIGSVQEKQSDSQQKHGLLHDEDIAPWQSRFALDLYKLIECFRADKLPLGEYVRNELSTAKQKLLERIERVRIKTQEPFSTYDDALSKAIINHLTKRLDVITNIAPDHLQQRIDTLIKGLKRMDRHCFPIIEVPAEILNAESENESMDPPLAVLFKRIGTGGSDLKTADYVFSVIKHHNPDCHSLVEQQTSYERIAAIFMPTTLVMTAVRLTAAKLGRDDYAVLDKRQFTRLMRGDRSSKASDFSRRFFLTEFNAQIAADGEFVQNLRGVLNVLTYNPQGGYGAEDVGLPKHALALIQVPALEVILFWLQKNRDQRELVLQKNRHQLVRFLLCWHLSVLDSAKASALCFQELAGKSTETLDHFPEKLLFENMITKKLALPLRSPAELKEIGGLTHSNSDVAGLRGWRRFSISTDKCEDIERDRRLKASELYKRWWNLRGNYSHAFLLWLQRAYVSRNFEAMPAQPGLDDDTPYDFDHICPQSHWNYWTGKVGKNRLIDFHAEKGADADDQGHWRLGNAIGNVRVWDSSNNRSDGDASPHIKLKLQSLTDSIEMNTSSSASEGSSAILRDSAISDGTDNFIDERQAWMACAPIANEDVMYWTKERAIAFQKAIEGRTFNLYQQFHTALRINELTEI